MSVLRLCLVAALLASPAGPGKAGDFTHDRILGFSEDGAYFAFKTYGLQRGSGLPYAEVFVVDLARNIWVPGTPFRAVRGEMAMAEVEAAPFAALEAVRRDVLDAATPMLQDRLIRRPATRLYAAGIGQAHGAGELTRIAIPHPDNPTAPPWHEFTLRLAEEHVPAAAEYCPHPDVVRGYRLDLLRADGQAETLHQDQRIPASRGCAQAYRLDAVVSAGYPQAGTPMVAMISVWAQGFEGLERRVIAAPLPPLGENFHSRPQPEAPLSPDAALAEFLQGSEPLDPDQLDAALPARARADPGSLFWPDANLSPVARATEILAAQAGFSRHGRLSISRDEVILQPEGAGGPMTVSLIRMQAFNLGEARRNELLEIFGSETLAPAEAFGIGPHVEWRFAMRPVQGMRADILAAGRREIAAPESSDCGPVQCLSPEPLDRQALGLACDALEPAENAGTATRLGQAFDALGERGDVRQWVVEHGLWQADAFQIIALDAGGAMSCNWVPDAPD